MHFNSQNINFRIGDPQLKVLRELIKGLDNRQIAANLILSPRTVQTHISTLLQGGGFENRTALALWASRQPRIVAGELPEIARQVKPVTNKTP